MIDRQVLGNDPHMTFKMRRSSANTGTKILHCSPCPLYQSSPHNQHIRPARRVPRRPALLLHRPNSSLTSQARTSHLHRPPAIALIQFVRGGYEAAGALYVIIFQRCCNSVRSFCLVIAPESLCRFMDAEPSRPNSWFFQLYNVGLHTPTDWAMVRALVFLVQSSTTAAFFISNGC